jgi:hypothetical protein
VLDADTYRTDLELRLISPSLRRRLIDPTACVAASATCDAYHRLTQSAFTAPPECPWAILGTWLGSVGAGLTPYPPLI